MNKTTGYRALPQNLWHPRRLRRLTEEEFQSIEKQKIQSASPICEGHQGTIIWYSKVGYIVQVRLKSRPDIYIVTLCTFTPTFGMDSIDGMFAQDAEEYILQSEIGFQSERLNIYGEYDEISMINYLKYYGLQ